MQVATIAAVKQLLLETLDDLSNKELQELKRLLKIIFSQKDLQMVLRHTADRAEIVDLMVETYGQQSVELTREVFMDLNRTDLVQRLSKPSSGLKEKPSVDDHQTALLERVSARAAVRKLLFETLNGLSFKELEKFKFLLKFTYFQKSLPQISEGQMESTHSAEELVDLMVENLLKIQQSVEVTKEVFMDMNRTDLVQRLSETSSGLKEKQQLSLIQRVETMASVIELLLETLKDLSYEEFEEFKKVLSQFKFFRHSFLKFETTGIQLRLLEITDKQDTVFSMVQTFGQKSVQTAKDVLMLMKKTDLVQRFSDQNPGPKKKHSVDEHLSALIHKVATMASVKELLSETLNDLSSEEFKTFKWLLQFTLFKRNLPHILLKQLKCADWAKLLVDVMVEKYGQQSVEVMKEVFMDMNRMDLVQRLSETSSGLKEKHSVDEHWPALTKKVETMVSVIELLLETLKDLTYGKFKEFKEILRQIHFPSFRLGKWRLLETMGLQDTVFFLVQTFGQRSLETIKEILKKMKRTDLDQRLSDSSSGSKKKPSTDEQRSAH
ncbi:uncharacterized protein LOC127360674 [Dicentrarchus labrax]|uniref:uncharacterized protein LOC127360674 n=1 Tax=Dicentrarchus labrax TaxID=13489 RepID=UPI0021F5ECC0|nr:uncharacterized protein LOC127360674 [Dicentrarchus labrax]